MSKINVYFNNKDYSIDEQSFSADSNSLKLHLQNVMNGSGATVVLGGQSYEVDSAKLLAATNDFITHLGLVDGNGYKVVVGGVEYSVDSTKVAGAVSDLEIVLSGLNSGDSGEATDVVAGLYHTGSNYAIMLKSWDELVADGTVHVDNGVVYTNMDFSNWTNGSSSALAGDLVLPNDGSVTKIGDFDFNAGGNVAFAYCPALTKIKIPGSATIISNNAFYVCAGLTNVEIGNGTTVITKNAFYGCSALMSVRIPSSVITIEDYAFADCRLLSYIDFDGTVEEWNNIVLGENWNQNVPATHVVCSNGTVHLINPNLAPGLYESYSSYNVMLKSWDELVADGTVHVENGSVYTNLQDDYWTNGSSSALSGDLVLPNDGSITELRENAFYRCRNLTGIIMPDSVQTIGEYAFYHCCLDNIHIGNGITRITANAFHSAGLQSVIIPDTVTVIEDNAFNNNTNLSSVDLGNGVTTIGEYVFVGSRMQSIVIPKSVTKIGSAAISEVYYVYFDGTVEEWNNIELCENWINLRNEPKVVCSDGTVAL